MSPHMCARSDCWRCPSRRQSSVTDPDSPASYELQALTAMPLRDLKPKRCEGAELLSDERAKTNGRSTRPFQGLN
jgi:hypothetical protein